MSLLSWNFTSLTLFWNEVKHFLRRVNFNIILSSANKSNAFIPYKKSCFYKMKSLEKRKVLWFRLRLLRITKIWPKISLELLKATLNFILNFLNLEIYHKNQVHGSDHALSNILHKSAIILILSSCCANSIHQPNFNLYLSFCI